MRLAEPEQSSRRRELGQMTRKFDPRALRAPTALLAALATTTAVTTAHAEPKGVDWERVIVELDRYARGSAEEPSPTGTREAHHAADSEDPSPQNMGNAWFGVAPRVALVARDWASSTRIAGDRLSLMDAMRLSASTRMVVGRARLSSARFTPFVQVGLGQWRVDRNYLPLTPATVEVATQLGGGFEVRLAPGWQLAAEATATTLIREGRSDAVSQTVLWGTKMAVRFEL